MSDATINMNLATLAKPLAKEIIKELKAPDKPRFLTISQCATLKGINKNTLINCKVYQPCGGLHYRKVGGRIMWEWEKVEEWLSITDADLPEYLEKWGVKASDEQIKKWRKLKERGVA